MLDRIFNEAGLAALAFLLAQAEAAGAPVSAWTPEGLSRVIGELVVLVGAITTLVVTIRRARQAEDAVDSLASAIEQGDERPHGTKEVVDRLPAEEREKVDQARKRATERKQKLKEQTS